MEQRLFCAPPDFPSAQAADKQTVIDINTSGMWEDVFHPSDASQHCVGWVAGRGGGGGGFGGKKLLVLSPRGLG